MYRKIWAFVLFLFKLSFKATTWDKTPVGFFKVVNKIKNRPYYTGHIPGGDPRNPLEKRWLGLNANGTYGDTYGIQGNNNESSIGKYVIQGCVRMHNTDIEKLYDKVQVLHRLRLRIPIRALLILQAYMDINLRVTS